MAYSIAFAILRRANSRARMLGREIFEYSSSRKLHRGLLMAKMISLSPGRTCPL